MNPITELILVVSLSLTGSFMCSLFEAVIYTVSIAQAAVLNEKKKFGGELFYKLRTNIDEPISAILTINTLTHTVGATLSGGIVAHEYGEYWVGIFAGLFTITILLATEIIPKSLGVRYAVQVAPWIAWPLQVMIWVIWPVVWVCQKLSRLIGGAVEHKHGAPTANEIMMIAKIAAQAGSLRPQEQQWIENALQLGEIRVYDMMTPRTVVYSLPADLPLSMVTQRSEHWIHSRLPLTEDRDPDRILGMVYRREVFDAIARGQTNLTLRQLMHEIDFVPDSMRGHKILDKFIKEKKHMAAVVDEYGGFEGVITLEDVLECLLGSEIVDEHDRHVDMQELARQRAQARRRSPAPKPPIVSPIAPQATSEPVPPTEPQKA